MRFRILLIHFDERLEHGGGFVVDLATEINVGCAAERRTVGGVHTEYPRVGRKGFGIIASFNVRLAQGNIGCSQLRITLDGGLECDQRRIYLFQPVARQAKVEKDLATW